MSEGGGRTDAAWFNDLWELMLKAGAEAETREMGPHAPYRWCCNVCGTGGRAETVVERDGLAMAHLVETSCGAGSALGAAEDRRLLHVWTYGRCFDA